MSSAEFTEWVAHDHAHAFFREQAARKAKPRR